MSMYLAPTLKAASKMGSLKDGSHELMIISTAYFFARASICQKNVVQRENRWVLRGWTVVKLV